MKNKDVINIYWAPSIDYSINQAEQEMFYPEPQNLYNKISLIKNKNLKEKRGTIFQCPAIKNQFANTFVFKNVINSEYEYDFSDNKEDLKAISEIFLSAGARSHSSLSAGPSIILNLSYIFFADQPVEAFFTQPTFDIVEYTKYGSLMPGNFNIGKWYRPYNIEIQMWNEKGKLIVKEDEPIFYVYFHTDKKIKLHRYKNNEVLQRYASQCSNSPTIFGEGIPLIKRYKRFADSRLNEAIIKEIKKNTLEN